MVSLEKLKLTDRHSKFDQIIKTLPSFQEKKMNPNKRSNEDEVSMECQPRVKKPKLAPISNLEEIINRPGLQHIAEEIFLNLDFRDIMACTEINKSCEEIIENPIFWLKKWRGLSQKNHEDWIEATLCFLKIYPKNLKIFK